MNGLKKAKDMEKEEFLQALKKELGDKYNKAQEDRYLEQKDEYGTKSAGVAIRQIAEQFRYLWETKGVFINAKPAPTGTRGGEGIQAFFVSPAGKPIIGFLYGTGINPFEFGHTYTLSGRETPTRATHRIVNYNDEGEMDDEKVLNLLEEATEKVDELFIPEEITKGGLPVVAKGKIIPFVQGEPEWPDRDEREPGENVRPIGEEPLAQYVGGKLQPCFNAVFVDEGEGRARFHVGTNKTGQPPMEWFIDETDLSEIKEMIEQDEDASQKMAQLVGNQGATFVGNLYRVQRALQPDNTERVYRDIDLFYAIPNEEAAEIEIPTPKRAAGDGTGAEFGASVSDTENEIKTMIKSFGGSMTNQDLELLDATETNKKKALQNLISNEEVTEEEEDGETVYKLA